MSTRKNVEWRKRRQGHKTKKRKNVKCIYLLQNWNNILDRLWTRDFFCNIYFLKIITLSTMMRILCLLLWIFFPVDIFLPLDIMSHSAFIRFNIISSRRFLLLDVLSCSGFITFVLMSFRCYLPFDSLSTFFTFRRFSHQPFVPVPFCPSRLFTVGVFYFDILSVNRTVSW